MRTAGGSGHFRVFDFSTDPTRTYTFWAGLFGGIALTLATHGTDQFLVQRLLSARSVRGASAGLILSGVLVFAQFVLFLVIGAMLFTFYQHTPLPRPLGRTDEVLPLFVVTSLPQGVSGFIVAAIVAAALSPSINSLAATTVNDFYLKYVRPDADEDTLMRVARQATIGWGVAQIVVALAAQWVTRSVLDSGLSVLSLAAGPVLGAFLTGVLTTRVRSGAMLGGMAAGAAVLTWAWSTNAYAFTWYALTGAAVTGIVALLLSLLAIAKPGWPSDFDVVRTMLREAVEAHAFPAACIEVGGHDGARWTASARRVHLRSLRAAGDARHDLRSGVADEGHRRDDAGDARRRRRAADAGRSRGAVASRLARLRSRRRDRSPACSRTARD